MVTGARRAIAFLTAVGGAAPPAPAALAWFPVVGGAVGGVLGLAWWAMGHAWAPAVGAVVVVGLDLVLSGLLHLDGLADTADGLLPHLDRQRRLAVMRQPTVGAFGVAVVGIILIARVATLASIAPSVLLLAGIWAASRAFMAVVARSVPYARAPAPLDPPAPLDCPGLASGFLEPSGSGRSAGRAGAGVPARAGERSPLVPGVLGAALAEGCLVAWHPLAGSVSLVTGVVAAAAVVWLAVRRLGGFTGDVLGAAGMVLETVALLVAAARWG